MQTKCKRLREKIIGTFVNPLRDSSFYQVDFKSALNRCSKDLGARGIEQILCYGLGSFHDGVDIASRYQLALLVLLHEHLTEQGSPLSPVVEVYDPSFDQLDKETLLSFMKPEFKLINENEYCARKLSVSDQGGCILFYMPHLDKYLYNNLLGVNWSPASLSRLVVLGNSFREMIDKETTVKCKSELHYMNQLVSNFADDCRSTTNKKRRNSKCTTFASQTTAGLSKALIEHAIDDTSFDHSDIFNSLSFHFLDEGWLAENSEKIQQTLLHGWTCVTSCTTDEWAA